MALYINCRVKYLLLKLDCNYIRLNGYLSLMEGNWRKMKIMAIREGITVGVLNFFINVKYWQINNKNNNERTSIFC